jgi:hypothetical protein
VSEGVLNGPSEGETLRNARGNRTAVVKAALPHVTVFEFTIEGLGTMMAAPPGVEHGFTKRDPGTVRFLNIHAPGGFEGEMRRMSV